MLDVGSQARAAFAVGDRVACAGAGQANHAEVVAVARNLTVRVPDAVSLEDAAFVTVGAIALQGVRIADVRLGEACVVIGLGLVGQLTVQLLKAAGCRVFGIDVAADKVELARAQGADAACLRSEPTCSNSVRAFSAGPRRRRHPDRRGDRLERPGAARRRPGARSGRRRRGGHDRHGRAAQRLLRKGAAAAPVALVRARPLRPDATRKTASTIRSATCAGPSSATWRRFSTWSRRVRCSRRGWSPIASRSPTPSARIRSSPARSPSRTWAILLEYPADRCQRGADGNAGRPAAHARAVVDRRRSGWG